jgi:hypothetical protein
MAPPGQDGRSYRLECKSHCAPEWVDAFYLRFTSTRPRLSCRSAQTVELLTCGVDKRIEAGGFVGKARRKGSMRSRPSGSLRRVGLRRRRQGQGPLQPAPISEQ